MTVKEVSEILSYRLEDPVTSGGNADGNRFSAKLRLMYIQLAMRRLMQILETFHYSIDQALNNYYQIIYLESIDKIVASDGTLDAAANPGEGYVYDLDDSMEVVQCYIKGESTDTPMIVSRLDQTRFLTMKHEMDVSYGPDINTRYFCEIDSLLHFLPIPDYTNGVKYINLEIVVRSNMIAYDYDASIPLSEQFLPLLISLAVQIAASDIRDQIKAGLARQEISDIISTMSAQKNQFGVNPKERP